MYAMINMKFIAIKLYFARARMSFPGVHVFLRPTLRNNANRPRDRRAALDYPLHELLKSDVFRLAILVLG